MTKPKLPADPGDYFAHSDVSLEELAKLYKGQKGCSFDNLRKRSAKEKWVERRHKNGTETAQKTDKILTDSRASETAASFSKLEQLKEVTIDVHLEFMQNLKGQIKTIQNPYLFDGERTNSLFQTAMNNSVKVLMAVMKAEDERPETPDPSNLHRTQYKRSFANTTSIRNYASKPVPGLSLDGGDSGAEEREDNNSD